MLKDYLFFRLIGSIDLVCLLKPVIYSSILVKIVVKTVFFIEKHPKSEYN